MPASTHPLQKKPFINIFGSVPLLSINENDDLLYKPINSMHGKIDLNLFTVLLAIYNQGSITAAAKSLYLSQPAISHALGRLRESLNDELFVRHGRSVVPTPYCQKIIASVEGAVNTLEHAASGEVSFDIAHTKRQLNLGLRDILESIFFPTLIPELLITTPNLTVASRQVTWPELAPSLTSKEVDIVVDVLVPTSNDIRSQLLCHESFCVVCAPDNIYLKTKDVQAYAKAKHALVTLKDSKLDTVDLALAQHNLHRDIALQCEHYFAAVNVVSNSNLLLTMPSRYAQQFVDKFDIAASPIPLSITPLAVHMYWHKQSDNDLVNSWMRDKLMDVANGLGL